MSSDGETGLVRNDQNKRGFPVRGTLFALLILFVVACVYSFFLVFRFQTHIAAFQKQGAGLLVDYGNNPDEPTVGEYGAAPGPFFMPAAFIRYHRSLYSISLRNQQQSSPEDIDELFRLLRYFPKLGELSIEGFSIDAKRAAGIAALPRLKNLAIRKCQIEPTCLAALLKRNELTHLSLADSEFPEAELQSLVRGEANDTLTGLSLSYCNVTDECATVLSRCRKLEFLELDGTQIGDTGLKIIARLPQLKVLILDHTKVTDAGARYLSSAPDLVELSLSNTEVSDEMVETLSHNIPALRISDD